MNDKELGLTVAIAEPQPHLANLECANGRTRASPTTTFEHHQIPPRWVIPRVFAPGLEYAACFASGGLADWFLVCLLAQIQGQGYDQAVDVHETVQVSLIARNHVRAGLTIIRVGDIVDVKANGAVQKGSVEA